MKLGQRGRGRPPSSATLEARRCQELLKTLPTMTAEERAEVDSSILSETLVRNQILKEYKYGATTPDSHAFAMASLGDESLKGFESVILLADQQHERLAKVSRQKGTHSVRQLTQARIKKVLKHYERIIADTKPFGRHSVSGAADRILKNWPSDSSLLGEAPSKRTLREWLRQYVQARTQFVGKVSMRINS